MVSPGQFENLEKISNFVKKAARNAGFNDFLTYTIETAVDEACSNIIEHAYGDHSGGDIEITILESVDRLTITLKDSGQPFNPNLVKTPYLGINIDDRQDHGLGIYMMRQWMDSVEYSSIDGFNVLTLIKNKVDSS